MHGRQYSGYKSHDELQKKKGTERRNSDSPVLHIGTSSINFLLLMVDEPEVKEYLLHLQARAPITTRKSSTAVPVPASSSICWLLSTVTSPTTPRFTRTDNKGLLTAETPGLTAREGSPEDGTTSEGADRKLDLKVTSGARCVSMTRGSLRSAWWFDVLETSST